MKKKKIIFFAEILIILLIFPFVMFSFGIVKSKDYFLKEKYQASGWSIPINISNTPRSSESPLVGADARGKAYVIWIEYQELRGIYFSTNNSGQWSNPEKVATIYSRNDDAGFPSFTTTPDGECHFSYQDVVQRNFEILHYEYENKWSNMYNISQSSGGSAYSSIRVDPTDNYLYTIWMDGTVKEFQIMIRYRDPATKKWGVIETVPLMSNTQYLPELAIDGKGTAHLVWMTSFGPNSAVWYSKNPEPKNYTKWTSPTLLQGSTNLKWCWPRVSCDNDGNVYVVWIDNTIGNWEVFLRKKINEEWQETENISKTESLSDQPTIAVDKESGNIYVAWAEYHSGKWNIFLKSFHKDEGWAEVINVSDNSAKSGMPNLFVDSKGGIHLVYSDDQNGNFDIIYTCKHGKIVLPPVDLSLETRMNKILFFEEKINIIKWKNNPDNEENENITISKYSVYRKEIGQDDSGYNKIYETPDAGTLEYRDRDLPLNRKYVYAVTAWDQDGNESEKSDPVSEG